MTHPQNDIITINKQPRYPTKIASLFTQKCVSVFIPPSTFHLVPIRLCIKEDNFPSFSHFFLLLSEWVPMSEWNEVKWSNTEYFYTYIIPLHGYTHFLINRLIPVLLTLFLYVIENEMKRLWSVKRRKRQSNTRKILTIIEVKKFIRNKLKENFKRYILWEVEVILKDRLL